MQKTKKQIALAVLFLLLTISAFFTRPLRAEAFLGFGDVTWIACLPFDFNCAKEGVLDPIATGIVNSMIRQVRAAAVNWIITGDLEIKKPFFITSFIGDPQRIADTAARLFLSELTGINFCSFHPSIQSIQALMIPIPLDFNISCNFSGRSNEYRSNTIGGIIASSHASQNFSTILNNVKRESQNRVQRSISSFAEEVRTNSGFLGQRDPKTGKVKTPGTSIAGTLMGVRNAEDISNSTQKELFNAIVDIIDIAIGQTIQKGLIEPISK